MTESASDADFEEFRDSNEDGSEWEIEYEEQTRTTTLMWIAYRALEDDDATVTKL